MNRDRLAICRHHKLAVTVGSITYCPFSRIMFEGLSLGGSDVVENLKLMKELGRNGYMRLYRTLNV